MEGKGGILGAGIGKFEMHLLVPIYKAAKRCPFLRPPYVEVTRVIGEERAQLLDWATLGGDLVVPLNDLQTRRVFFSSWLVENFGGKTAVGLFFRCGLRESERLPKTRKNSPCLPARTTEYCSRLQC